MSVAKVMWNMPWCCYISGQHKWTSANKLGQRTRLNGSQDDMRYALGPVSERVAINRKLQLIASYTQFAIELRLISIVWLIATLCEMGPWTPAINDCKCKKNIAKIMWDIPKTPIISDDECNKDISRYY